MKRYFTQLNYSLGDEDSSVEMQLLADNCPNVLCISGSGGRVLPLLHKNPQSIYCVDILEEQLFFTQLRVESLKSLEFEEFCGFWGYPPFSILPTDRKRIFNSIELTTPARDYLLKVFEKMKWEEPIYYGKFEKTLQTLSKVINLVMGKSIKPFFECETLNDQKEFLAKKFPWRSWRLVLSLLANSTVLNALLYKGEFPVKNIEISTYEHFKNVFNNIFEKFLVKESYFAQMVFLGKLHYKEGNLPEADQRFFQQIKEGARNCKISYMKGDLIEIANNSAHKFDFVSLSDVPSFFNKDIVKEKEFLNQLSDKMEKEGLIVTRGSLRVCHPNLDSFDSCNTEFHPLLSTDKTQLWQIDVYRLKR